MLKPKDFTISKLGPSRVSSPIHKLLETAKFSPFVAETDKIVYDLHKPVTCVESAGPRRQIYFHPRQTKVAIVTCGGLCPGINDVIRGLVMTLYYRYGVRSLLGIPYGYRGCIPSYGDQPVVLTPDKVARIHEMGGTLLGSSRGHQDPKKIVHFLKKNKINILYTICGDGTLRGSLAISQEIKKQKLKISIVGIPKTVDNDILYLDQSFGYETAFSEAVKSISSAHVEAQGTPNGIGLIKLMGRH